MIRRTARQLRSRTAARQGFAARASLPILLLLQACLALPLHGQTPSLHPRLTERIGPWIESAIDAGEIPGCVVAAGRRQGVLYCQAFGQRQREPRVEAMTVDTVFDLASLTKPIATATSVVHLVERGKLRLDAPVADYLPEFAQQGKQDVTIRQLLIHRGGLIADNAMADYQDGPAVARQRIMALPLRYPADSKFVYSDVGFLVLGRLVESVSGQPLDQYAQEHLFLPGGMHETGFCPDSDLASRAAPTEKRQGDWIRGSVHDPRSFALGGVAGHAGLFSTAADLARYARMMLAEGALEGRQVLHPETVRLMTSDHSAAPNRRGLGWDKASAYSSNRASRLGEGAFGHGGFTGTVLWIDPEQDLFYIVLSNRLHPAGQGSVNRLAARIGDAVIEQLVGGEATGQPDGR